MTKFILVRHGLSTANNTGIFCGQYNAPLAEEGFSQAEDVAKYVCENYKIDAIYSSDLSRVVDTITPTAELLNLEIIKTKELREINVGNWQGKSLAQIEKEDPETFAPYQACDTSVKLGGAESFDDAAGRALNFLKQLAKDNPDKTILIGSHGGVIRTLCAKWTGTSFYDMRVKYPITNASITEVVFDGDKQTVISCGYDKFLSSPSKDADVNYFKGIGKPE